MLILAGCGAINDSKPTVLRAHGTGFFNEVVIWWNYLLIITRRLLIDYSRYLAMLLVAAVVDESLVLISTDPSRETCTTPCGRVMGSIWVVTKLGTSIYNMILISFVIKPDMSRVQFIQSSPSG